MVLRPLLRLQNVGMLECYSAASANEEQRLSCSTHPYSKGGGDSADRMVCTPGDDVEVVITQLMSEEIEVISYIHSS